MNKINFKGSVMLNPTPVVLVTSINKEGKTNVFTIGWVSTVCTKPPVIAVGIRPEKSKLGLKLNSGVAIDTPSLEISPVALECKLKSITPLGTHDMFLLDVINVKVNENLLDEKGKIHFEKANLIAYSHGEYFGLDSKPLGSFGYSIRKKTESRKGKNAKNKRQLKNYKKNRSLDKNMV